MSLSTLGSKSLEICWGLFAIPKIQTLLKDNTKDKRGPVYSLCVDNPAPMFSLLSSSSSSAFTSINSWICCFLDLLVPFPSPFASVCLPLRLFCPCAGAACGAGAISSSWICISCGGWVRWGEVGGWGQSKDLVEVKI